MFAHQKVFASITSGFKSALRNSSKLKEVRAKLIEFPHVQLNKWSDIA